VGLALDHQAHERQLEQRVGGGADGDPLVSLAGDLREDGVDDHQLDACGLRLLDEVPVLDLRIGDVGTPHDDGLGVLGVGGLVAVPHHHAHEGADVVAGHRVHAVVAAHIQAGADVARVKQGDNAAVGARDAGGLVARGRQERHGRLAVLALDLLDLAGDLRERLVPRDALPLPGPALGALGTAHGVLQALGIVDALNVRQAALADAVVAAFVVRRAGGLHHLAVVHVHVEMAEAEAVGTADAPEHLLLSACRSHRRSSLGQRRHRRDDPAGHGGDACRGGGRLEEATTREPALRASSSRHLLLL